MTKKCCRCMERDAEPSFVRCEPCMVRDMTAEVRFVYEQNKTTIAAVQSVSRWLNSVDERLIEVEKHVGLVAR